jgi:hypothetical protein
MSALEGRYVVLMVSAYDVSEWTMAHYRGRTPRPLTVDAPRNVDPLD